MDTFNTISHNEGDMSKLDEWVRGRTDALDADGNHHCGDQERLWNWFCGSGESRAVRDGMGPTGLLFDATMPYELVTLMMNFVVKAVEVLVKKCILSFGMDHEGSGDASGPETVCFVFTLWMRVSSSWPPLSARRTIGPAQRRTPPR